MKVFGKHYLSVWADFHEKKIFIINQTLLPFEFKVKSLSNIDEVIIAIKNLEVRGAPAIGITASYAMWLSYFINKGNKSKIHNDYKNLLQSRPTAVNLKKGLDFVYSLILQSFVNEEDVFLKAKNFSEKEIIACKKIGEYGVKLIEEIYKMSGSTVNILTHCNAGWLACGDFGTALSPIFEANKKNIPIHVWIDETRPLNQGSRLTAWELHHENIPYHIITDNSGGLLMHQQKVNMVIVGADTIALNGDVANKIGTYLKALAAKENNIPFYVAAPTSTFDRTITNGNEIIIEERNPDELRKISAFVEGEFKSVKIIPDNFYAINHAFDVTPAKYITAYITENGILNNLNEIL